MPPQAASAALSVKLFGPEALAAQRDSLTVELPGSPRAIDVLDAIGQACPALRDAIAHCRLAVNHEFVDPFKRIEPGDEVALIGLVSGG